MIFAKPSSGFNWVLSQKAQRQLSAILTDNPNIEPYWDRLRDRLIHTGHREGQKVETLIQANVYVFSMELDNLPNVQVVYTILGQSLTIQSIRTVP